MLHARARLFCCNRIFLCSIPPYPYYSSSSIARFIHPRRLPQTTSLLPTTVTVTEFSLSHNVPFESSHGYCKLREGKMIFSHSKDLMRALKFICQYDRSTWFAIITFHTDLFEERIVILLSRAHPARSSLRVCQSCVELALVTCPCLVDHHLINPSISTLE